MPFTHASSIASVVADFNGDGRPDIAFATSGASTNSAFIFMNTPATAAQPTITSVIGASAFGAFPAIASGSWIEIYGANLARDARQWAASDFAGSTTPTALDGTSVQVNGKSAVVYYISSQQVNALVPDGIPAGKASVTVTAGNVTSAPFQVNSVSSEPGLLAPASFNIQGKQYVVAQLSDGTYVLPTGAIAGVNSRPAKPGEVIVIYGIGFGPATNSAQQVTATGQIASGLTQLTAPFTAAFGSAAADVKYDGLAPNYVGLYQFNVTMPAVPDSNTVPVTFSVGGAAGAQTLFTAVHQ